MAVTTATTTSKGAPDVGAKVFVPRRDPVVWCGNRSPGGHVCNRPPGHGGRHNFAWLHVDGRVREVWS